MSQKKDRLLRDKFILDACCGGRYFWFDKHHENTLYIDIREEEPGCNPHRPNFCVKPDIVMDFRHLKFNDKTFKLIVWDPPHLKSLGETSVMRMTYGCLHNETWTYDLKTGFNELWRVLEDYGVLVFKWHESEIPLKEVLKLFHTKPLFGNPTNSGETTKWCCFMKIPKDKKPEEIP